MKQAMRQLVYRQQQVELGATPFILPDVIRSCRYPVRESHVVDQSDETDRARLLYVVINELNTLDPKKVFYLKVFLRCLFFVFPLSRDDFAKAFALFFQEQVENCLAFENSCRIGELSQLVINARNLQSQEHMSSEEATGGHGFTCHHQLDFLLGFCARYFIRPFPSLLFHSVLRLFRTSIILSSFNSVSKFLYSVVLTQPELAKPVAVFFVHSWPWMDSSREVLYLRQVECTFVVIPEEQQKLFFAKLFARIKMALQSPNRFVSLQCIQFVIRIVQNHLYILSNKVWVGESVEV